MRKWLLFALVGLVLLYTFSIREGVDDTLTKEPGCPSGMTLQGEMCRRDYGAPALCSGTDVLMNGVCTHPDGYGGNVSTPAVCEQGRNEGGKCVDSRAPRCPDAYIFETEGPFGKYKCITGAAVYKNRRDRAALTDPTSEYTASDLQDTLQGPLPAAIDERIGAGEPEGERSTTGPVFGANGPFSGQAGTGQGSGMNAATALRGNSYGPPGTSTTLDPYDLWPGTKGNGARRQPVLTGTSMEVRGPTWGGRASGGSSSSSSPAMTAQLYGPTGGETANTGWGHSQINSADTSTLPSYASAGSEPENAYAVTSRVPGDMDLFPNPYIQSSTYSIANGSQKTDPVPFLTDFSAFQ